MNSFFKNESNFQKSEQLHKNQKGCFTIRQFLGPYVQYLNCANVDLIQRTNPAEFNAYMGKEFEDHSEDIEDILSELHKQGILDWNDEEIFKL